jgi:transcription-repair coupling factor (superfamily II helicase)
MTNTDSLFSQRGKHEIASTSEGHDAYVIGGAVARGVAKTLLHICRDDGRMARTLQALQFFYPDVEVIAFPAWDCLPYDRVSPNAEITSRRIDALTRLIETSDAPRIVLTTMNAALQRMPPRKAFEDRVLRLAVRGTMPVERLISFLGRNGYSRADTVREPGEFAVRGGIVDLYPSGSAAPLRLDFFGDELENIRVFDALSQRTTGPAEALVIKPVSEVLLDETSISRFRSRYREQFGTVVNDDPLYEAVSAGHRYIGVEHWLPLFYESLETIFDYLPGAAVSLDHQSDGVRGDRLETINDFYAARRDTGGVKGAVVYRPVEPKQLFLDAKEWGQILNTRALVQLSPFGGGTEAADGGAKPGMDFSAARADPSRNLFDIVQSQLKDEIAAGKRVLIAAYSAGSGERLGSLLKEHGAGETLSVPCWEDFRRLPPTALGLAVLAVEHGFRFEDTVLVTEQDMLGERLSRPPRRRANYDQFVAEVATL